MKTFSNFNRLFFAFAFVLFFGGAAFGQIKVGGYKSAAVDNADVAAAAAFAVAERGEKTDAEITLESIAKAESQIVAGTNYRLCLEVSIANADEDVEYKEFVKVVVFRDLKKQYSLTSWVAEECTEDDE